MASSSQSYFPSSSYATSSSQPSPASSATSAPVSVSTPSVPVDPIDPFASNPISRTPTPPNPAFTASELAAINGMLHTQSPEAILRWSIKHLPRLFQTTAFGLTGTVALDIIHRLAVGEGAKQGIPENEVKHPVDLIFIDTLYHFNETLDLAAKASEKYGAKMHVYLPPAVHNRNQFEALYGQELWKTDEESYDYLVKVEPARRAYTDLDVRAVITGRRKSQGGSRSTLLPLEIDETGLIKVNPLCNWTFDEVKSYATAHDVPYNALLDQGYKSIGDWHSTAAPGGSAATDAGERSGRWQGRSKDECGLHQDYFKMKKAFAKRQRERERQKADEAREATENVGVSTISAGFAP